MSSEDDEFSADESESESDTTGESSDEFESESTNSQSKTKQLPIHSKNKSKLPTNANSKQKSESKAADPKSKAALPTHAEWMSDQTYKHFTNWKQNQTNERDNNISEDIFTRYLQAISKTKTPGALEKHFSFLKVAVLKEHGIDLGDLSEHLSKPVTKTENKNMEKNKSVKRKKSESNDDSVKTKPQRKRKPPKKYEETSESEDSETDAENKKESKLKSKVFTAEDVERFLHEAPDFYHLCRKAILIFGIHGGCTFEQLRRVTVDDVQTQPDQSLLVNVRRRDMKIIRTFTIHGEHLKIVRKYMSLRPNMRNNKFFCTYVNGKCAKTGTGHTYYWRVPRKVAGFLKLPHPEMYRRDCFELTSKVILNGASGSCFNKPWTKGPGENDNQDESLKRRYADWSSSEQSEPNEKSSKNLTKYTKYVYNRAYRAFMDWKQRKGEENFTEQLFLEYFKTMAETHINGSPNYVTTEFYKLRTMMMRKHGIDFSEFKELFNFYKKTRTLLGSKYTGREVKRFTAENVDTFQKEAPDDEYLVAKVILIFEMNGGTYLREIKRLSINDVQKNPDDSITVNLRNSRSKTSISFTLRDEHAKLVTKYMTLRPTDLDTDKFLVGYHKGKFNNRAIGIHTLNRNSKVLAGYLNLPDPDRYSMQCFRRPAKRARKKKSATHKIPKTDRHKDSEKIYNKWYNHFMDFKFDKGEEDFTDQLLIEYFQKLAENKAHAYVTTIYGMLKAMILQEHDVDLYEFEGLRSFIKENKSRVEYKGTKVQPKMFTAENVETFLHEAPDDQYILMKVVLIFGINSGCLIKEFPFLSVNDVQVQSDTCVTFRARDSRTNIIKTFFVRDEHAKIVNKYISQRPTDLDTDKFFIRDDALCKNNKRKYSRLPLNKQHIHRMGKKVAAYLKLPNPEQYQGSAMSHPNYRKRESHIVEEYVFDYEKFNQDLQDAPDNEVEENGLGHTDELENNTGENEIFNTNDDFENSENTSGKKDESIFNANDYEKYSDPKPSTSYDTSHSQSYETKFINIETSSDDLNAPDPLNDNDDYKDDGYHDFIADDDDSKANIESETANQNVKETIISLPNKIVEIMFINCENVSNITINLSKRQL